jgi:nucleoside-diphosphate-sugar epimerase
VTGAGGFIGPSVVLQLKDEGAIVRALVGPPGVEACSLPPDVSIERCDIIDEDRVFRLVEGVDVVVHMAGAASVRSSFERVTEYTMSHVVGTATILSACRKFNTSRLVYISSAEVYGKPTRSTVDESQPLEARSPYAAAKIGAEQLVKSFVYSSGLDAVILRPFSIYGSGISKQSVLGTIIEQARSGDAIVMADLRPVRDYCHVHDLAKAIVSACTAKFTSPCVLNVGTGTGTSVGDLCKMVLRIMNRKVPVRESGEKRPGKSEIYRLVADPRLAFSVLGWKPHLSLRSGLQQVLADWIY